MPIKKNRNVKALRKIKNQHLCNTNLDALVRLKNEKESSLRPEELDLMVIDSTLKELYNEGDKVVVDFKKDVLDKYGIHYTDKMVERYWDILDATNLVNPVVGFGNSYKLSLTANGYNLMLKFGSYKNYVQAMLSANGVNISNNTPTQQGQSSTSETYYDEGQ